MAKKPWFKWEVYFVSEDGAGQDIFLGHKRAPTERSACNLMRAERWGRNTPYDHIGGILFAKKDEGVPPIYPKPRQRPLPGV